MGVSLTELENYRKIQSLAQDSGVSHFIEK